MQNRYMNLFSAILVIPSLLLTFLVHCYGVTGNIDLIFYYTVIDSLIIFNLKGLIYDYVFPTTVSLVAMVFVK